MLFSVLAMMLSGARGTGLIRLAPSKTGILGTQVPKITGTGPGELDKDEDDGLFNHSSINCSVSISCDKYILLQYYSSSHQFRTIPHLK